MAKPKKKEKKVAKKAPAKSKKEDKEEVPEEIKKLKATVDKFKDKVLAKFDKYVLGISLLPPEEEKKDQINIFVMVDDSDSQKMTKEELRDKLGAIIQTIGKEIDERLHVETEIVSEFWQNCHDGKYEQMHKVAVSQPIFDTGVIDAIRISELHKRMSLEKFERYIVCYVAAGALFRGQAHEKSDIDVFIVIDDTDVKKMSRAELKDRLTAIMYEMAHKAAEITGVKRKFHIQTYILTDFWDSIKDANPVIFTFLRDGIPFFDRGIYMPWKQLLKMGKIKPSAESIDMFINSGEQFMERAKGKILSAGVEDSYYAILNPSQAALMMYGINPTTPRETARLIREIFVKKEKILEKEYADIIEEQVKVWKKYEYDELKELGGKEAERLIKNVEKYLKRIKEVYEMLEEKRIKEDIVHAYDASISATRDLLKMEGVKKAANEEIPKLLKETVIHKGKLPENAHRTLQTIVTMMSNHKKGKTSKQDAEKVKKESRNYIKMIVELMQRSRGQEVERSKLRIKYDDKFGEIILFKDKVFIIHDLDADERTITKAVLTKDGGLDKIDGSDVEELEKSMSDGSFPDKKGLKSKLFEDLRTLFGKNVEILVNN